MRSRATAMRGSAPSSLVRSLQAGARRGAGLLLDALLPPHCLTCEAMVEAQGSLCADCFRELSFVTAPCCDTCGVPFPHAGHGPVCPACMAAPPPFAQARAALRYDAAAQKLVLPFKHADRTELAAPLARHMARAGAGLLQRAELIVPVPLHWRRLLRRRYNQAALLGRELASLSGRPLLPDALRRTRPTPPLGHHGAAERAALLEGAFVVAPGRGARLAGRQVLLVDDVMTSGATAAACSRALLAAGAAAVRVLAAARVPDRRLDAQP